MMIDQQAPARDFREIYDPEFDEPDSDDEPDRVITASGAVYSTTQADDERDYL